MNEHDDQIARCFASQSTVNLGERMIIVLKHMMTKKGRTSVEDVRGWTGGSKSLVQRLMKQLNIAGYLECDGCIPAGFKVTEKAKQLFTVNVTDDEHLN